AATARLLLDTGASGIDAAKTASIARSPGAALPDKKRLDRCRGCVSAGVPVNVSGRNSIHADKRRPIGPARFERGCDRYAVRVWLPIRASYRSPTVGHWSVFGGDLERAGPRRDCPRWMRSLRLTWISCLPLSCIRVEFEPEPRDERGAAPVRGKTLGIRHRVNVTTGRGMRIAGKDETVLLGKVRVVVAQVQVENAAGQRHAGVPVEICGQRKSAKLS